MSARHQKVERVESISIPTQLKATFPKEVDDTPFRRYYHWKAVPTSSWLMTEVHEDDDDRKLIADFKAGRETAAQELFDKYCERLMTLARRRIGTRMNSRLDPEDVIQSAFRTFFVHVRNDDFKFQAGDDLFKLLVRITVNKTLRQIAYHRAAKRNPACETGHSDSAHEQLMQVMDSDPTPEAEVALIEQFEKFLAKLNPFDRQVLELKLQGHSTAEIAEKLGSYERKIRRVLERVRTEAETPGEDSEEE